MAKGAWIGIGGKAKKIKNMYIGIGGKAKKVKKAWIGVGGKAKLFFSSGGEISKYTGTVTELQSQKSNHAGGSVGGYAIFLGGDATGNTGTKYIDIYSSSLVNTRRSGAYKMLGGCKSATIGNLAIFNGGEATGSGGMGMTRGYTFNNSLTMTELTNFYKGNCQCGAASNGTYAFFAGGFYWSKPDDYKENRVSTVCYYNSSGTATTAPSSSALPTAVFGHGGGRVGNYVVFAGGHSYSGSIATVTAYNASATRTSCTDLGLKRRWMGTGTAGANKYVIFAGGHGHPNGVVSETATDNVDIYNESLTRSAKTLSSARCDHTGGTAGELAVFAGGGTKNTGGSLATVIYFDESLTEKSTTDLSSIMRDGASAVAGEYFLISGGTNHYKVVDVYKFS